MLGKLRTLSIAAILACSVPAFADSLSIDFNGYSTGTLPGSDGADTRTPGGSDWWYPSNAATGSQVVTLVSGGNALNVFNNGNGNDGVIANVLSPRLNVRAGEPSTGAPSVFNSSYMFRSVSSTAVSGFTFKSETWGQDRSTWVSFSNDGSGNLVAQYDGATSAGAPGTDAFTTNNGTYVGVTSLTWGAWYTVDTTVHFVNGANPDGSGNDVVTTNVYDANNHLVWTATDTTWEQYYRYDAEQIPNGNQVPGADAIDFQMRTSTPGAADGVFIDNLTLSTAAPLPASAWMGLALLAGLGIAKSRQSAKAV
jgi:hypothetical protein